ncbi:uncharacterized protein LOC121420808 [Lytechinus variegatus]|uniref:uncharacterized protein LOC121420808 n=1 Tax=Lytechinus variegatus TaxID=7654 RepID=UPI001BB22FF6|nr:uncharacterized protein LOC121420808 [Lytechinus variegatus]
MAETGKEINQQPPLTDIKLDEIGEAIGDNPNLLRLGLLLGFQESKIHMFRATNHSDGQVTAKGTKDMLFAWRNKTRGADQVRNLREALEKAQLVLIAEEHL